MYFDIYNVILNALFGSSVVVELTSFQLFVVEFLSYVCCASAILMPIALVYYVFKFVARSIEWDR